MVASSSPPRFHPGHALAVAAVLLLTAQAYSWPVVTPILVLAAIGAVVAAPRRLANPGFAVIGFLGVLVAWGAVSALWAIDSRIALKTAWTVAAAAVPGLLLLGYALRLESRERVPVETGLIAGYLLGLANAELLLLTNGGAIAWIRGLPAVVAVFGPYPQFELVSLDTQMTLIGLLTWPMAAVARRRFGLLPAAAAAAAGFLVVLQSLSGTAKLAYILGGMVFALAHWRPRHAAFVLGGALAVWIAVAPTLHYSAASLRVEEILAPVALRVANSIKHRNAIWNFAIERIGDRPVLGWGLGNSRVIPGGNTDMIPGLELMPLHPHNDALQLRLELGLPGALLGAAFVLWLAGRIRQWASSRVEQALALALLADIALNAASSYNLWHTWWMTFMWWAAIFAAAVIRPVSGDGRAEASG
jgi:O-antigen ligase